MQYKITSFGKNVRYELREVVARLPFFFRVNKNADGCLSTYTFTKLSSFTNV